MLKLHGIRPSNYYSIAKACLLEKAMDFEEVQAPPSQKEEYLAMSPMGKVPVLEAEGAFISEAFAIAEYLDGIQGERPLLPVDPFLRAKAIELYRHLELDVELVARRCLPEAFFGATVSDETKEATKHDLAKGLKAVGRLIACDPYAIGSEFTLADLYTNYTFGLASNIAQKIWGDDILADLPQVKELMGRLAERDSIKQVAADQVG